ncbi:MAG: hypothetical protein HRT74_07510 [Flavobacteriales bacterium]|nr:hypothetical protein [Flavobacteriales bacterium]
MKLLSTTGSFSIKLAHTIGFTFCLCMFTNQISANDVLQLGEESYSIDSIAIAHLQEPFVHQKNVLLYSPCGYYLDWCSRGYESTWMVQNDSLFLTEVSSCCMPQYHEITDEITQDLKDELTTEEIVQLTELYGITMFREELLKKLEAILSNQSRKVDESINLIFKLLNKSAHNSGLRDLEFHFPKNFKKGMVHANWVNDTLIIENPNTSIHSSYASENSLKVGSLVFRNGVLQAYHLKEEHAKHIIIPENKKSYQFTTNVEMKTKALVVSPRNNEILEFHSGQTVIKLKSVYSESSSEQLIDEMQSLIRSKLDIIWSSPQSTFKDNQERVICEGQIQRKDFVILSLIEQEGGIVLLEVYSENQSRREIRRIFKNILDAWREN